MGSGRRPAGRAGAAEPSGIALVPGCWGFRWTKTVASFLTCEKSCFAQEVSYTDAETCDTALRTLHIRPSRTEPPTGRQGKR